MIAIPKFSKNETTDLDKELERLFAELDGVPPETPKYSDIVDQIVKLYKLKEIDSKKRVSSDVLVGAATNLFGILLILNFEHAHVLTSKAASFIFKSSR